MTAAPSDATTSPGSSAQSMRLSAKPGGFADQPPAVERQFAQRMGATTVEIPSSHVATVSYPAEVVELIEQATQPKGDPP